MGRERTYQNLATQRFQETCAACRPGYRACAPLLVSTFLLLTGSWFASAGAQVPDAVSEQLEHPGKSDPIAPADNPSAPRRHFRLKDSADLSDAEAARVYNQLKRQMVGRYMLSRLPRISGYQKWTRLNRVPYRSASHGQRYLNNYANDRARAYARFEEAGKLPVGAMIAKDSITIRSDGSAVPGALFLMEKMPEGFSHASGDWRYTMIMPDGSIFGTTGGVGAKRVHFCISCHLAVAHQDHLFFIPKEYRQTRSTKVP